MIVMESKSVKIPVQVYRELLNVKEIAVKQAKASNDNKLAQALVVMGIGAFAGWLIFRAIQESNF